MTDSGRPLVVGGRWRLLKQLGEGRTGNVWQARDTRENSRVAVKILHRQLASHEPELKRFAREFEVLRRIDDANVVRAIHFGVEEEGDLKGSCYLVMEHVEGRRLSDVLGAGGLDLDRVAHIGLGIARAMRAAHAHEIVHRDLEPSNILLVRSRHGEQVKVLDFGVARLQSADDSLTEAGVKLGTAEYMSPEYVDDGELDARSDLYALGVLMYAMITGAAPFVGPAMKVMQDHVTTQPQSPSLRTPGLPMWLEVLTMRLLAKDPAARPQTASEVVEELENHLHELDQDMTAEREMLASLASLPPEPIAPAASVGHHTDNSKPVYPDPKPVPKLPMALAVGFAALAAFGVLSLVGLVAAVAMM
ncbi:MAG: serine/threonine protein kinase [Alphaproteobacteria bacterium]|nr:serine/threonine protein kinase [Alphaproteobacteria bacterium]MCB9698235.1 serine/threonine protein kinase [Alphaproteobacteria bacterium]